MLLRVTETAPVFRVFQAGADGIRSVNPDNLIVDLDKVSQAVAVFINRRVVLVTQAEIDRKIRRHLPIVLREGVVATAAVQTFEDVDPGEIDLALR